MDLERVVVAEILRPRGNRGEILARSQTDVPGRLENLKRAIARMADGSDVSIEIAEAWAHNGDWVLKFADVDSIDAAERFRRADLWISLPHRGTLPEGEFFQTDLVGCAVTDAATGKCLGAVAGWQQYGGPPLMEVSMGDREVLIPFVSSICRHVDVAARTITVELPEGLLDL
ncbi:MAG: ribosome maturation factor RimM [Bryobacteraceae bacterium]